MAKIELQGIRHAYPAAAGQAQEFALKEVNQVWDDGGAYALLGPSGCGKTTLLNIISGLLTPTEGAVLFDGVDITHRPTVERQIAQVFQFPVVYDTMTVYNNLAFPLRNRGMAEAEIDTRVRRVAAMLDIESSLQQRASGLSADGKQKISLGRGLVRPDVNVIMFDEPLTVIDPHLKWLLRSKLKELHQQIGVTMIYVTHDQTEALTFAEKVVVMYDGTIVQVGTPVELFERPNHTFVGHFIGSPGMNVLACESRDGEVYYGGHRIQSYARVPEQRQGTLEIGIRPEFVEFVTEGGIPVELLKVDDLGRYQVVTVQHQSDTLKMVVAENIQVPSETAHIQFKPEFTHLYLNDWILPEDGNE